MSERLSAVMAMVPKCRKLADIGCDHAYVSIRLVENGVAESSLASDVREGPLVHARKNVAEAGLTDKIEIRKFPGAEGIKPGEADCILISGMGGRLTEEILRTSAEVIKASDTLVLEPQSDMFLVRQCIRDLGFCITNEDFVIDSGKYYQIICAIKRDKVENREKIERLSERFAKTLEAVRGLGFADGEIIRACDKYGPVLLSEKNELMRKFLLERKEHFQSILSDEAFVNSPLPQSKQRLAFVKKEAADVNAALGFYGQEV